MSRSAENTHCPFTVTQDFRSLKYSGSAAGPVFFAFYALIFLTYFVVKLLPGTTIDWVFSFQFVNSVLARFDLTYSEFLGLKGQGIARRVWLTELVVLIYSMTAYAFFTCWTSFVCIRAKSVREDLLRAKLLTGESFAPFGAFLMIGSLFIPFFSEKFVGGHARFSFGPNDLTLLFYLLGISVIPLMAFNSAFLLSGLALKLWSLVKSLENKNTKA